MMAQTGMDVLNVLKKFKKPAIIETDHEREVLRRYATTGMVSFGYNSRTMNSEAVLTEQGKWFVKASKW